jgi:hypothetical protein
MVISKINFLRRPFLQKKTEALYMGQRLCTLTCTLITHYRCVSGRIISPESR